MADGQLLANIVSLDAVLATDEFLKRPARQPDYKAESRALAALAQELGNSPLSILQRLVETTLSLCQAHSSGISLLDNEQGKPVFRWPAIAGEWATHVGGTTPRDFSPCGVVLDRGCVQLFSRFDRYYAYFSVVSRPTHEALLIPFYVDGKAVGTLWVVSHDDSRHFDPEDYRLLGSVAHFASLAYRSLLMLDKQAVAQEALRQSETRTHLALDVARLGTWTWDMAENVVLADERCREICGVDRETTLSLSSLLPRVHDTDRPRIKAALQEAIDTESSGYYAEEFRIVHDDGAIRWVVARGQALSEAQAEGPLLLGTVLDITERKQAEEALREADRRKDEFLAMLGHELRNPLATISTRINIANMGGNKLTISEQIIERQVGLMVRLIDDLLDVSRIASGKIMLQVHRVELACIIRDAIETSRPGIDSAGHTLTIDTPVEPVFLNADPHRLEQIIVNLLNNAAKYTTSKGHIELTARRDRARLILSVKDNGIGMQPDMLSNVFDPFTQIDHSLKMSQGAWAWA